MTPARLRRPFQIIPTLAGLWLGGCSAGPALQQAAGPRVQLAPGDQPATRIALPAGTRLALVEITTSAAPPADRPSPPAFLWNAWWRVAMRQSARFDIAAGIETCPTPHRVRLHFDAASNCLTTTLERPAVPALALAAVCGAAPAAAVDRLAWLTRAALGEVPAMPPVPCAASYSAVPECVRLTELGLQRRSAGDARAALQMLERARGFDGGCTLTMLHLAATLAGLGGEPRLRQASAIVTEALGYRQRLTPHVEHRLARVLLTNARDDQRLLELGEAYRSDRPHDPHATYSVALALNKLGRQQEAVALLESLRQRWPQAAGVRYQLCFALLATGDHATALEVLDEARQQLPPNAAVRPYAMALFHAGKHDELRRFLLGLRQQPGVRGSPAEHEVIRMQASHELLVGATEAAVRHLAESLDWVRRHSADLRRYTLDVVEDGEVLARLGAIDVLQAAISGYQQLGQLPGIFADGLTYLGGLAQVHANQVPTNALSTLARSDIRAWHGQLQAAVHHSRGELEAETRALERAVDGSTSPLLQASVARALAAAGKTADARAVASHVQRTLLAFDQRKPYDHPLMTPSRALAFLATR